MKDITTKFYYIRDCNGQPRITVCLIKDGDEISRGIAICSLKESPRLHEGRNKAWGRATRAMIHKHVSLSKGEPFIRRPEAHEVLDKCVTQANNASTVLGFLVRDGYWHAPKWEYAPKLTPWEDEILYGHEDELAA